MGGLLFGTGGIPLSSAQRSTVSGIERIKELGLGCMEVEFVQGITMSGATASSVSSVRDKAGIVLSCHAPYFINFNSREADKVKSSVKRLFQTARIARACGARNIVFHAAFYLNDSPEKTYDVVKERLSEILPGIKAEGNDVVLRPEVTGRPTQFGTVAEVLRLCKELPGLLPCIDLAHWHARTREFNTYGEVMAVLKQVEDALGRDALGDMHFHFSGIAYGAKGEIKHLPLKESDLHYLELLKALVDYDIKGLVICESPNLEEDALLLQSTYYELLKTRASK